NNQHQAVSFFSVLIYLFCNLLQITSDENLFVSVPIGGDFCFIFRISNYQFSCWTKLYLSFKILFLILLDDFLSIFILCALLRTAITKRFQIFLMTWNCNRSREIRHH
ncbi:hypothetical protein L9F63_001648, partial [Diploptera punctata]